MRRRAVDVQEGDPDFGAGAYRQAAGLPPRHPALATGAIAFLSSRRRRAGLRSAAQAKERLLCVFNFAAEAAKWVPPAGLGPVARLDFPGEGAFIVDTVELPAYGCFFGRLNHTATHA